MSAKLVVLRALKLGDLLVTVPALRAIRRYWPEHRILLACPGWLEPVVELTEWDGRPCVDEVLPTSGLGRSEQDPSLTHVRLPDVVVNLHGRGPQSTRLLDSLNPAKRVGHRGHGWDGPEWTDAVDLHERERWCRMLMAHGVPADRDDLLLRPPRAPSREPGAVVVHPGAAFASRRWPVSRFAEVARSLTLRGHRVVVTGSAGERDRAQRLADEAGLAQDAVLAGRTSVAELAALIAGARLVVCGDTGVAHLSYAFATPSVVLFGPVSARQWGPPASGPHLSLSVDERRAGDPFSETPDPALLGVEHGEVLSACESLLSQPGTERSRQVYPRSKSSS